MTEHTESVIRLIYRGKIVGYEYRHKPIHCGKCAVTNDFLIIEHSDDIEMFNMPHEQCQPVVKHPELYIPHDSFNLGFKFGDKWVFEGDKVKMIKNGGYVAYGVVEYEEPLFIIGGWYLPNFSEIQSITVTGNIYEARHE
jgi:hypothetical protein